MRLLFVLASPAPGGAETLVRNMCAELTERGHQCHVAFLTHAAAVGNRPEFEAEFLADLTAKGIGHSITSHDRHRLLHAASRLKSIVREFNPDLVHVHLVRGLLLLRLVRLRIPIIYTHHSMAENMAPMLFRLIGRVADHFVAVGEASLKVLQRHFSGPFSVIRNGVPSHFMATTPRSHPSPDPFILSVGTLGPLKDYGTLIETAALLVPRFGKAGKSVRFAIAGGGTEMASLERLIEERKLTDNFELLGARSDVAALMRHADLLVNSSVSEGFPITLIEAAASALPVVATAVGGNPEVVEDGVNGYLAPPRRPDLLADRIYDLLADTETYAAFSARAAVLADEFTIAKCVDAHEQLYRRLLSGP